MQVRAAPVSYNHDFSTPLTVTCTLGREVSPFKEAMNEATLSFIEQIELEKIEKMEQILMKVATTDFWVAMRGVITTD